MKTLQLLPIAMLVAMNADELDALAKDATKVEKDAKSATDNHKSSFPAAGKIVCALEERLNNLISDKKIASNTSLATYWKSITDQKLNNHALSCANAFGTYVRTGLIDEKDYDLNSANCLELASSISSNVGGMIEHEAITAAAAELKERGKDEAKNLRAILDSVKERKVMDAERAKELLAQIFADGHLELAIHTVGAQLAYETDADQMGRQFDALKIAVDMSPCADKSARLLAGAVDKGASVALVQNLGAQFAQQKDLAKVEANFLALMAALDQCGTQEQQGTWLDAQRQRELAATSA